MPSVSIISRMSGRWNRAAKLALKAVGLLLFVFALLIAAGLTYSTTHGYMGWWFCSSGSVVIDGSRHGYMHINKQRSAVIITRTDSNPHQSYLVTLSGRKWMIHCGEWHAPRLPAFPIGDVNPPCSIFSNGADLPTADNPIVDTLKTEPRSMEFQTMQGRKVSASW
jgi:hypothetical protein